MNMNKPTRSQKKLINEIDDAALQMSILLNKAYDKNILINLRTGKASVKRRDKGNLISKHVVLINGAAK